VESEYDYLNSDVRYVKVFTPFRRATLGQVVAGKCRLTAEGRCVYGEWTALPFRFPHVKLDAFGIMPNFFEGIIVVDFEEQRRLRVQHPRSGNVRRSSLEIISSFQSATRRMRFASVQKRYVEICIQCDSDLRNLRQIIREGPTVWSESVPTLQSPTKRG
jgi:hypothetical protein